MEIRFAPGGSELATEAKAQVDRLAVRAAMCSPDDETQIILTHARGAGRSLTRQRLESVRRRLAQLGLAPKLVLQRNPDPSGLMAARHSLLVSAFSGGHSYCSSRFGRGLQDWLQSLRDALGHEAAPMPGFWLQMDTQVLRQELAFHLLEASYCDEAQDCDDDRRYWWLIDVLADSQDLAARQRWLQDLWERGSQADYLRLQARLRLDGLPLWHRAESLAQLVEGQLPWPLIEARATEPGVLAAARQVCPRGSDVCGYSGEEGLLRLALLRGELGAFGRLAGGANGPARDCYVAAVMEEGLQMNSAELQGLLPTLVSWFGPGHPIADPAAPASCDSPFRAQMLLSGCWLNRVGQRNAQGEMQEISRTQVAERLQELVDAGLPLAWADMAAQAREAVPKARCAAMDQVFYERALRESRLSRAGEASQ
ncbi:MAG: hypothetical protein U1E77_18975 [Inhella sp.]